MSIAYNQVLIHYRDAFNRPGTSFWTLQDQSDNVPGPLVGLATLAQACSNAAVYAVQYQTTHLFPGAVATDAAYPTIFDRVHTIGKIGLGYTHYDLYTPKIGILLPNHKTLDLANPDVAALVTAMTEQLGNASGIPLSTIIRGSRQWAGPPP